jgi:ribokinase
MKKFDVITIGSATRDVFLRSRGIKIIRDESFSTGEAECFTLGSKIEVDDIVFETGGGGTNTAVSFARQGLRTAFVGKIGATDARGREILQALEEDTVNTSLVIRDKRESTGYSVLLLTARGERTVLVYRGASADFRVSELPWRKMQSRWVYVSSLGGKLPVIKKIWAQAKRSGTKIAWNPGDRELAWGLPRLKSLLAQADVVLLNQEEAEKLVGLTSGQDASAFNRLRPYVHGITVVTQGVEGALAGWKNQAWHCLTHPIHVNSTAGAGDAFGSGFVGAYIRTKGDVPKSLQFATANSESVIQHVGAKQGLLKKRTISRPARVEVLSPNE